MWLRSLGITCALAALFLALAAPAVAHHREGHQGGPPGERGSAAASERGSRAGERGARGPMALHGEIVAIAGSIWTVERSGSGEQMAVNVSDARVRWPGNRDASIGDFSVGDVVNVQLRRGDATGSARAARAVHFVPGGSAQARQGRGGFSGAVSALSPTALTVLRDGAAQTFSLDAETRFRLGRIPGVAADLRPGDRVTVRGDRETLRARTVIIRAELARTTGRVTAVSPASLTIDSDGTLRTFQLSARTVVREGQEPASTLFIQVGDRVQVTTRSGESMALMVVIR